jgi:gluconolactonase
MTLDHHSVGLPDGYGTEGADVTPATAVAFLEGPACTRDGTVYFSDIANNRILTYSPGADGFEVFREPSGRANGLLLDHRGRLLACEGNEHGDDDGGRRVTRTDLDSGEIEVLTDNYQGQRYNAPNDVAARSNGQIFFTDPCYGNRATMELDHDSVYRIDTDGSVTRILTQPEIQRPNGIQLAPDQSTLYLVDSCPVVGGNRKIWAFDLSDDGTPSGQRLVYDFAPGRGGDGMVVDSQGTLYIAAGISRSRGPHETTDIPPGIWVITPDGEVKGRIPIVEDVLTNVTFGGDDLKTLYVAAGKTLFATRVDTPGWVVHRQDQS